MNLTSGEVHMGFSNADNVSFLDLSGVYSRVDK